MVKNTSGAETVLEQSRILMLRKIVTSQNFSDCKYGGVAEWFKATVLKTVGGVSRPWVQILPPPPVAGSLPADVCDYRLTTQRMTMPAENDICLDLVRSVSDFWMHRSMASMIR